MRLRCVKEAKGLVIGRYYQCQVVTKVCNNGTLSVHNWLTWNENSEWAVYDLDVFEGN
jgi:hypothetical protein